LGLFLIKKFLSKGASVISICRHHDNSELGELEGLFPNLKVFNVTEYSYEGAILASEYLRNNVKMVDVLINNASKFEDDLAAPEDWGKQYTEFFNVHMLFPAIISQALCNLSKDEHTTSLILNITDIFVENPSEKSSLYCSTKAGLENLSLSMAKKYAPNIRVNTIKPGPIKFLETHSDIEKVNVLNETLLSFEGGYLPIFQAVEFLMDNNYITGTSINVDGGRSANRR